MKKTITLLAIVGCLNAYSQTAVSIYEVPSSGNSLNRFEHDDNFLYAVRDSSVDKIDATTNAVTKLFKKPWGASINASAVAIFSNGKSIIGQYLTSPTRYKYWVYNGTSFDTLFTSAGAQISNWVVDGNVCYFYLNKKLYKSDFTKNGTSVIASLPSSTLVVTMEVLNHDLYYFYTTNSVNNNAFKKYSSGGVLSVIDTAYQYSFSDYKMQKQGDELYFSHYQFMTVPNESYKTEISKIAKTGTITNLYTNTTASGIYNKGFMGKLKNDLFLFASNTATSAEYLYKINTSIGGVPTIIEVSGGGNLKPQSVSGYKQATNIIYIDAYDPTNAASGVRDLWQTDGTTTGTIKVPTPTTANITSAPSFTLGNVDQWTLQGVTCGDKLFSIINYFELWATTEQAAPEKVVVANSQYISSPTVCNGDIFIKAQNATNYKAQILKLSCDNKPSGIENHTNNKSLLLYPNPSTGSIRITLENEILTSANIEIYNAIGKKVAFTFTGNEINLTEPSRGIYFLKYSTSTESYTSKIIIE